MEPLNSNHSRPTNKKTPSYPKFLNDRISNFYADFIEPRKNKKHLVLGTPSNSSSIILSDNDYLSISNHPKIINRQIEALQKSGCGLMMSAIFF